MTYPINKEKMLAACEQKLGPADETTKELFSLYIDEINRAYQTGLEQGQAKVNDFRNKVVDRLGDLCSQNDYNSLDLIDIVENIDEVLREGQTLIMGNTELRPCPFCSGEGKYQKYDIWHTVECKE